MNSLKVLKLKDFIVLQGALIASSIVLGYVFGVNVILVSILTLFLIRFALWYLKEKRKVGLSDLGFVLPKWNSKKVVIIVLFFSLFSVNQYFISTRENSTSDNNIYILFNILLSCFLTPILEELLDRVVLYNCLLNKGLRKSMALIIQALIFSLLHVSSFQSLESFSLRFFAGLILGFMYTETESIIPGIFAHGLLNAL